MRKIILDHDELMRRVEAVERAGARIIAEKDRIRHENRRLRAALEKIAQRPGNGEDQKAARLALGLPVGAGTGESGRDG